MQSWLGDWFLLRSKRVFFYLFAELVRYHRGRFRCHFRTWAEETGEGVGRRPLQAKERKEGRKGPAINKNGLEEGRGRD